MFAHASVGCLKVNSCNKGVTVNVDISVLRQQELSDLVCCISVSSIMLVNNAFYLLLSITENRTETNFITLSFTTILHQEGLEVENQFLVLILQNQYGFIFMHLK